MNGPLESPKAISMRVDPRMLVISVTDNPIQSRSARNATLCNGILRRFLVTGKRAHPPDHRSVDLRRLR
jgi:hypothetical protein